MATEITMPKLSDTMTEGLFAAWRKQVGDHIERGEIIAEVETDKAVMELEAFASGTLIKTFVNGGEQVPVGTVLGLIGDAADMADVQQAAPPAPVPQPELQPAAAIQPEPKPAPSAPEPHGEQRHDKASPLVRRLAREQDIDLEQVIGSGPEGRITQEDLQAFLSKRTVPPAPAQPASETASESAARTVAVEPLPPAMAPPTPMRQAIAATVSRSWQTIPHFSVTMEIDMAPCREVVRELESSGRQVGYNALLIKACALALKAFPLLAPASAADEGMHISFAVALEDGLLMPVVRNCDSLPAVDIERETRRLIEKCRSGRLTADEMSGGRFSVSNLGMYGVDEFTALIMPGQVAILAVGAVADRPAVRNGVVVPGATMRVTLCSDHRIIDGAYAARFLADLRATLEKPVALLV